MRKKVMGLLVTVGLFVGAFAMPASAAGGCQTFGQGWGEWARSGDGPVVGSWMGEHASTGKNGGYPVEEGPGVIARVLHWEMDHFCTD